MDSTSTFLGTGAHWALRRPFRALAMNELGETALREPLDRLIGPDGVLALPAGRRMRPPKLYRIGELVAYSGLSRQTVHNYTTMGLLREVHWTEGGHRLYDESAFERLDEVAEMKARGRNLHDIREHFVRINEQGG